MTRLDGRTAEQRAIVGRILAAPPARFEPTEAALPVHTLLSHAHLPLYLAAVKSLWRFVPDVDPVVHDDGTLTAGDVAALEAHVDSVTILRREDVDAAVSDRLRGRPAIRRARARNVRLRQLVDYCVLSGGSRILGMDSDVLFLAEPSRVLRWHREAGPTHLYSPQPGAVGASWAATVHPDLPSVSDVCCGFVCIDPPRFLDLDYLGYLLERTPPAVLARGYGTTTMLFSLMLGRAGASSLGDGYRSGSTAPKRPPPGRVLYHYMASGGGLRDVRESLVRERGAFPAALPGDPLPAVGSSR